MKDRTCHSKDCAIERFLDDIPSNVQAMCISDSQKPLTLLSVCLEQSLTPPAVIAASSHALEDHLLKSAGPIPLGSRATWMEVQKADSDCQAVYHMKLHGEAPRKKSTNPNINRIFKECTIDRGILVVPSFDNRKMRETEKIVIPPSFLDSILTVLHLKLNHPKQSQLRQVFDRYFFSPKTEKAVSKLYEACHICMSFKKFPKHLETYNPSLFPEHPGVHMNIDVLKRAKQIIVVNVDLFSFYITACFSNSEKSEDMSKAILQVTTPIRSSCRLHLRVDKAPAFTKLASEEGSLLSQVGISLVLAEDDNKNSNCSVDKAIDELEQELKKLAPDGKQLNEGDLCQATLALNNKIRKRGLTASEIHFSRDAHDSSNLQLDDKELQSKQKQLRLQNHQHLSKSRNPNGVHALPTELSVGDIVYTKNSGSKHTARDLHIVTRSDKNSHRVSLRKALHASHFDSKPINLSTRSKLVSNKFIFKATNGLKPTPNPENETEITNHSNSPTPTSFPLQTHSVGWNPVAADEEDTLLLASENQVDNDASRDIDQEMNNTGLDLDLNTSPQLDEESSSDTDLGLSSSDDSQILIFNDGQAPFQEERLIQNRKPKTADRIAFFDVRVGEWKNAVIIQDLCKRWQHYYNVQYSDGSKDGLYLIPDTRWTFRDNPNNIPECDEAERNSSPTKSLHPTPDSTLTPPPQPIFHLDLDTSISDVQPSPISSASSLDDPLNEARNASLEWDLVGMELESYVPEICTSYDSELHNVQNLQYRLPISSTPAPPRSRVSRLRQSLPLELEVSDPSPSFFQKYNPFRKKK